MRRPDPVAARGAPALARVGRLPKTGERAVVVRDARREDVPAIAQLAFEFAAYMRALGDETDLRLDAAALARDGFGPRPAFSGLVAETAGSIAGFLLFHDGYDTDAACRLLFIIDLFVTADARRGGVGRALMHEAMAVARQRGAAQLVWSLHRANTPAARFYRRLGAGWVRDLRWMTLDVA